ncbi:unnamed protein product [Caenorhabditis sp. 36 PRJEB53466]|nr:unnamed protein product [Caenorhabditis sp. 36 PRJEB53466]
MTGSGLTVVVTFNGESRQQSRSFVILGSSRCFTSMPPSFMQKGEEEFTMFDMTVPVWFLKRFFSKRYELGVKVQQDVLGYVSRETVQRFEDVEAGRYSVDPEDPHDLVDFFIARKQVEDEKGGHPAYTLNSLKHVLADLWLAGQDTTSTTLVNGFNQLVNNPHVIRKVREEVLRVTDNGSRPLTLQDRAETHYLNATLAEIQRHSSILNVNFWRINHEPTTVRDIQWIQEH